MPNIYGQVDPHGGAMSPLARPNVQVLGSGVEQVPALGGTVGAKPNGAMVGVCEWQSEVPKSVCVQLAFPVLGPGPTAPFPPPSQTVGDAGLLDINGVDVSGGAVYMAARIEYGCGSASQVMWCDWRPGAINLPPSQFVKVAAVPWGPWNTLTTQVQASIVAGNLQGAHVPTATGFGVWNPGETKSFKIPAGARAVAVMPINSDTTVVEVTGDVFMYLDYGNKSLTPSSQVIDIMGPGQINITSSLACSINVQWFMQT